MNARNLLCGSAMAGSMSILVFAVVFHQLRSAASTQPAATVALLRPVAAIDVPGPPGKRFDYLTIDYPDLYLLSNHLAAGLLYVIDTRTNAVVKAISDVPGAEGVVAVPELHRAYTADWYENKVAVIDLQAIKIIAKLPTKEKPDSIDYAQPFRKVYVSDERGRAVTVIEVNANQVIKTVDFISETGNLGY